MKYVMLFENFDKYDFKTYRQGDDLDDLYDHIVNDNIPFEDDDLEQMKMELEYEMRRSTLRFSHPVIVNFNGTNAIYFYVYNLGDYCYSVITYDRTDSIIEIEIVDDIYNVINAIKNKL